MRRLKTSNWKRRGKKQKLPVLYGAVVALHFVTIPHNSHVRKMWVTGDYSEHVSKRRAF